MLLAALLTLPILVTEPAAGKEPEGWSGSVDLSVSSSSGNTDNTVIGGRLNVFYRDGRYTNAFRSGINYTQVRTEGDGEMERRTTQDRRFVEYRLDAQVGDRTFAFARARYDQDEFSGFENRVFAGVGLGHAFAESENFSWEVLGGPGVLYTDVEDTQLAERKNVKSGTDPSIFLGSDLTWLPMERLEMGHEFDVTYSEQNTTVASQVSFTSKITETIGTKISYDVKFESDPPQGRETTDRRLRASVEYSF